MSVAAVDGLIHFELPGDLAAQEPPEARGLERDEVRLLVSQSDGEAIHTSTFLGNPLGCAMGSASLDAFRRGGLSKRAAALGAAWIKDLRGLLAGVDSVGEVRGAGLMIGSAADGDIG